MPDEPEVIEQQEQQEPPVSDGTITVELDNGEVYKGTPDQVIEALKSSKQEANRYIHSQKEQLAHIQEMIEQRGVGDRSDKPQGVSDKDWYALLAMDRKKAMEIAISEVLGVDPKEIGPSLKEIKENLTGFKENAEIAKFYSSVHLDEPLSKEDGLRVIEMMNAEGLPKTSLGYELAYRRLQDDGKIKGAEKPKSSGTKPPPRLPGTGTEPVESEDAAWTMPLAELRKKAGIGQG